MSAHPKRCAHCWKTSGENDNLAKELHNSTGAGGEQNDVEQRKATADSAASAWLSHAGKSGSVQI